MRRTYVSVKCRMTTAIETIGLISTYCSTPRLTRRKNASSVGDGAMHLSNGHGWSTVQPSSLRFSSCHASAHLSGAKGRPQRRRQWSSSQTNRAHRFAAAKLENELDEEKYSVRFLYVRGTVGV